MQTFDQFNWTSVESNWDRWWAGTLGRPLVWFMNPLTEQGKQAAHPLPNYRFASHHDFSVPARDILLSYEAWNLRHATYHGDAFPWWWANFGPGVLAAFIGGEGRNNEHSVWFYPGRFEGKDLRDIHFSLDRDAPWFRRVEEFLHAAVQLWGGAVKVGTTDLGGTLDVLSSFRPGTNLLTDLYDSPQEVKRLTWEIHRAWWEAYECFDRIIAPANHGYTAWTPMLSSQSYYMLQCDFAYMISPEMFEAFVKPELAASCKRLQRAFYHLDGAGQIPHVPHLCSIPGLAGIQWIPGEGQPPASEWPELLNEIVLSGKRLQVYCKAHEALKILSFIKKPELVAFIKRPWDGTFDAENLQKLLSECGIRN